VYVTVREKGQALVVAECHRAPPFLVAESLRAEPSMLTETHRAEPSMVTDCQAAARNVNACAITDGGTGAGRKVTA
jgi:hypothetical protein